MSLPCSPGAPRHESSQLELRQRVREMRFENLDVVVNLAVMASYVACIVVGAGTIVHLLFIRG